MRPPERPTKRYSFRCRITRRLWRGWSKSGFSGKISSDKREEGL
jgi:hypothetical protein